MDIDKLESGRELDALVAEQVMGYVRMSCWTTFDGGTNRYRLEHKDNINSLPDYFEPAIKSDLPTTNHWKKVPHYSTNISAAWKVVEKLNLLNNNYNLGQCKNGTWSITQDWGYGDTGNTTVADTAPLAICRAALKVVTE